MSVRLRELIRQVRACRTAADERAVVTKECALIRTSFKNEEAEYRQRNIAKLLFIQMLGYPTHFAQLECLKLVASEKFSDKRIGYLGLMLLLDEQTEVLMLVTNSLKNDLNHPNMYCVGLSLCALGNVGSPEMARDLAQEVEKLLGSSNQYVRKKAALCALRIVRQCPDLLENFVARARALISERHHGVLLTGLALIIGMCRVDPGQIEQFRKFVPALVRALKSLVMSGYAPEHDVGGVMDPFVQVKIISLLRMLGKGSAEASEAMNDVLAQVATNTETLKNVGNAILYECVQTIMTIEAESGLRVLAVNILGRFLLNRDNNIRYVALNTLSKVINADMQAVQRHRTTITQCLKDSDVSIRRRALDLSYALVNAHNAREMIGELTQNLRVIDTEFKEDLARNVCTLAARFAANVDVEWHVNTLLQVVEQAGNYIADDVFDGIITFISKSDSMHAFAVKRLYTMIAQGTDQERLMQVGAWCLGEYGEMLSQRGGGGDVNDLMAADIQVVEALDRTLVHPNASPVTQQYVLTALIKLTARLKDRAAHEKVLAIMARYADATDVELQQRACEYTNLYKLTTVRDSLLERMPVLEDRADAEFDEQNGEAKAPAAAATTTAAAKAPMPTPAAPAPAPAAVPKAVTAAPAAAALTPAQAMSSLLDLMSPGATAPAAAPAAMGATSLLDLLTTPAAAPAAPAPAAPAAGLLNLLTPAAAPPAAAPVAAPVVPLGAAAAADGVGAFPAAIVYNKNGLQVLFEFTKQPGAPNLTAIAATFTNANAFPLVNFKFELAVPQYIKLQMNPPSAPNVPEANSGKVTQLIRVGNLNHGQKPLLFKFKISCVANGHPFTEQGDVMNLPPGL